MKHKKIYFACLFVWLISLFSNAFAAEVSQPVPSGELSVVFSKPVSQDLSIYFVSEIKKYSCLLGVEDKIIPGDKTYSLFKYNSGSGANNETGGPCWGWGVQLIDGYFPSPLLQLPSFSHQIFQIHVKSPQRDYFLARVEFTGQEDVDLHCVQFTTPIKMCTQASTTPPLINVIPNTTSNDVKDFQNDFGLALDTNNFFNRPIYYLENGNVFIGTKVVKLKIQTPST